MPGQPGGTLRLTYRELAAKRGITVESAQRLARMRKWARVLGNEDGLARVVVPADEAVPQEPPAPGDAPGTPGRRTRPRKPPPEAAGLSGEDIRGAIEAAVAPIREELQKERSRVDSLVAEVIAARVEAAELRGKLSAQPARRSWLPWRRRKQ